MGIRRIAHALWASHFPPCSSSWPGQAWFEDDTAFTVAKSSGLGLIGAYGFVGARVSGASLPASLLQGSAVALVGPLLIALKVLAH